jgi:HPr kinase/phosphorylase
VPSAQPSRASRQSRRVVIPGTLLDIGGIGVLLSGDSGIGKSDAVLGLIDRGHRLIADDAVEVRQRGGRLRGYAPPALRGLVAVRGLGVLDVGRLFGRRVLCASKAIDLEIALERRVPAADGLAVDQDLRSIMELSIPRLRLPIGGGRDLPLLVETAAKAHACGEHCRRPDLMPTPLRALGKEHV